MREVMIEMCSFKLKLDMLPLISKLKSGQFLRELGNVFSPVSTYMP